MINPEERIISLIYEQLTAAQRYHLALALLQDYVPEDSRNEESYSKDQEEEFIKKLSRRILALNNEKVRLVEADSVFDKLRKEISE